MLKHAFNKIEKIRAKAGEDCNYEDKVELLGKCIVDLVQKNNAAPLAAFMNAYLEFKRGKGALIRIDVAGLDNGLTHLVAVAAGTIADLSADPAAQMEKLGRAMQEDRKTASGEKNWRTLRNIWLVYGCSQGEEKITKTMLDIGAAPDAFKGLPLYFAWRERSQACIAQLMRHGETPASTLHRLNEADAAALHDLCYPTPEAEPAAATTTLPAAPAKKAPSLRQQLKDAADNPDKLRQIRSSVAAAAQKNAKALTDYIEALGTAIPALAEQGERIQNNISSVVAVACYGPKGMKPEALVSALEPFDPALKTQILDYALRNAAMHYDHATCQTLVAAGADAAAFGARALVNAISEGKHDAARYLASQGADYAAAYKTATALDAQRQKSLGMFLIEEAQRSADPALYQLAGAAATRNGFTDKKKLVETAVTHFMEGKPAPLQKFFKGYMLLKRDDERSRSEDAGYKALVTAPMRRLFEAADEPENMLRQAVSALPPRDRATFLGLVLRDLCASNGNPILVDAVMACGGDAGIFGHLPLSLAVQAGHTDLALHLVHHYGASIATAIVDSQLNKLGQEGLNKLYAFMAVGQLATAPAANVVMPIRPVIHKTLKKPH
jgi:hypothetical protein